jgi:regulatory subunit for Cdc7p protein kinase
MATFPPLQRRPLTSRFLQGPSNPSPAKQLRISSTSSKRPRSPEQPEPYKRVRSATVKSTVPATRDLTKEQRIAEREQKEEEFRRKYSRSFPLWTFYLDIDNIDRSLVQSFKSRLRHLGAVCS